MVLEERRHPGGDPTVKILVLGAKGLAGSAFMRVLPRLGHECVPVTRENYPAMLGAQADALINASGNSAKYLAAQDPVGEIDRSVTSVLRACMDFHVKTHVLLSSADVYPNQSDPRENTETTPVDVAKMSPYGLGKYMAECVVRNRSRQWIILRLGGLLGPGLKKNPLFDLLSGQNLHVHPDSKFGYIHTDEVARIVGRLLDENRVRETLNVCGQGLVSVRQLMEWTGRLSASFDSEARAFRYEINNARLDTFWKTPSSAETAREFIARWMQTKSPSSA